MGRASALGKSEDSICQRGSLGGELGLRHQRGDQVRIVGFVGSIEKYIGSLTLKEMNCGEGKVVVYV